MRLQKPTAPSAAPAPPVAPARKRSRRRRFVLGALVVALAAWGVWTLVRPDPLRAVHAALDRRDFRTADDLLARHLAEHPDDRPARLLAARSARRGGDFARAGEHIQEYRKRGGPDEPSDLEAALLRAQTGNAIEGEHLFAAYIGRPEAPDAPFVMEAYLDGALRVLAPNHNNKVDLDGGGPAVVARLIAAAESWLRLRPGREDQVQGLIWLSRALRFGHEHAKGVARLREAVALDPEHFDARLALALAIGEEDPAEAVRHLERLRARRPDNRRVRFHLATVLRTLGRGAEARRILEEMIGAVPDEVSALIELGLLDLDEDRLPDAGRRLARAHELAPNLPEANIALSRYHQLAGRPEEAAKYRKRFDELEAAAKGPPVPKRDPQTPPR